MKFQRGQRIVFIGDSITDCGRMYEAAPFGAGYMNLVRCLVTARHPELGLTWVNRGISGNTVRDLAQRWDADAIGQRPDWLSVMIGINDVWRFFENDLVSAVPIEEYENTYRALLRRAVDAGGCRLILADPYLIEPDREDPQRAMSDRYGQVVAGLAAEFDAIHIRTQDAFDAVLRHTRSQDWADDRIHPQLHGHAVIAQAYLDAIMSR